MIFKAVSRIIRIVITTSIIVAGQALADTTTDLKVLSVGIQGNQMYIFFNKVPTGCPNPAVYQAVDATGQYAMSIALTARTSGMPIARIDTHVVGNACYLDLMQL